MKRTRAHTVLWAAQLEEKGDKGGGNDGWNEKNYVEYIRNEKTFGRKFIFRIMR